MNNADMPAQPQSGSDQWDSSDLGGRGLTKREHFAAMAMQGYIAAGVNGMPGASDISILATNAADALLAALNQGE